MYDYISSSEHMTEPKYKDI